MDDLQCYYPDTQRWSAESHRFVGDDPISVITPQTTQRGRSPSWNSMSLRAELVDDARSARATLHGPNGVELGELKLHSPNPLNTHLLRRKRDLAGCLMTQVTSKADHHVPGEQCDMWSVA